ncbi:MAG: hypothetical protein P4L22_06915 [Candidatus Babeliales bacterium]|nr:hypothetical protein [Candidatus Babeliales bacterium]
MLINNKEVLKKRIKSSFSLSSFLVISLIISELSIKKIFNSSLSINFTKASLLPFGQAVLYKPEHFFPVTSFPLWLSDTPEEVSDTWTENKKQLLVQ